MGCVLGTGEGARRRSSNNKNSVPVQEKTNKKKSGENGEKSGSALQAPEKLRSLSEFRVKTCRGWPLWLSEVAGDAQRDWTPRRANSFQKLDKVLFCCYIIYFSTIYIA